MLTEYDKRVRRKNRIQNIVAIIIGIIFILVILGFIAFEIYLWVHYGNMPKEQIPAWVWWWMIGRR